MGEAFRNLLPPIAERVETRMRMRQFPVRIIANTHRAFVGGRTLSKLKPAGLFVHAEPAKRMLGFVAGTVMGSHVLNRISQRAFRKIIAIVLLALGV